MGLNDINDDVHKTIIDKQEQIVKKLELGFMVNNTDLLYILPMLQHASNNLNILNHSQKINITVILNKVLANI